MSDGMVTPALVVRQRAATCFVRVRATSSRPSTRLRRGTRCAHMTVRCAHMTVGPARGCRRAAIDQWWVCSQRSVQTSTVMQNVLVQLWPRAPPVQHSRARASRAPAAARTRPPRLGDRRGAETRVRGSGGSKINLYVYLDARRGAIDPRARPRGSRSARCGGG